MSKIFNEKYNININFNNKNIQFTDFVINNMIVYHKKETNLVIRVNLEDKKMDVFYYLQLDTAEDWENMLSQY